MAVSDGSTVKTELLGGAVLLLEGSSMAPGKEGTKSTAQCTAFVRVLSNSGNTYKAQIWTARHCLPDFSSRILKAELSMFDGRSGYVKLDATFPLAITRNGFFDLVSTRIPEFLDAEKKQKNPARIVLDYTFLEEEGKKNYGADCKQSSDEVSSPNRLCSALQDFRMLEAELSSKSSIGENILVALQVSQKNGTNGLATEWIKTVQRQAELELDISRGRFVDIFLQCGESSPSVVCNYKDTLEALARKWRAPGRDLLAEAARDGYTAPGKSYSEFKKSIAVDHFSKTLLPLFLKVQGGIQGGTVPLLFAGNFADSTGKFLSFSAARLADFYKSSGSNPSYSFFSRDTTRDALMRFESPAGKSLILDSGDSGSALMFDESTPFMVLSAKGEKSISGGASILALPEATVETSGSADAAGNGKRVAAYCK